VERGALRQAARATDSYGLLLILLVINYVLLTGFGPSAGALMARTVAVSATVLLAFHTSHVRGRWLTGIRIVVAAVVVLAIFAAVFGDEQAAGIVTLVLGVLLAVCPVAVLIRILHHEQVGPETILGAICVYVMLGLLFALIDLGIGSGFVTNHPFFTETKHPTPATYLYFSYVTLTTTGYGDYTPNTGLPQTAAVLEAMAGQIFLVTLVARMVAMYRPKQDRLGEPGPGAPSESAEPSES
jgi:drug/metabolite transporter (DMT)-like permease